MMAALLLAAGVVEAAYVVALVVRPDPVEALPRGRRPIGDTRAQLAARQWTASTDHLANRVGCQLRRRPALLVAWPVPAPTPALVEVPAPVLVFRPVVLTGRPPAARRIPGATLASSGVAA